jgi:hypothetical protein
MNKLLNQLKEKKICLIASLPENNYELAKIAWEAGVDAIKVHVNVFHNASQNDFGTLEKFRDEFKRIIQDSPVPVGIVPGGCTESAEMILKELPNLGFDFISLYAHHTPASYFYGLNINNFLSVNSSYSFDEIQNILDYGFADMLELSIIDKEDYGQRLNARDLAKYTKIASMSDVPCIVPSQKAIFPEDIPVLAKTGVKALMVGAVVYGKEKETIKKTLEAFRQEIDKL